MNSSLKRLPLLLIALLASALLHAQKGDSILVTAYSIESFFRKDSVLYKSEMMLNSDNTYIGKVTDHNVWAWKQYAGNILYVDSILYNADIDLLNKKLALKPTLNLAFLTSDRYAEVDHKNNLNHLGLWKVHRYDSLNLIILYDSYNEYEQKPRGGSVLVPLKNGSYFITDGYFATPTPSDYKTKNLFAQRQSIYDTDTVNVNGKYGLYTRFGQEVIPPLYDSLQMHEYEKLIIAHKSNNVTLLDYFGNIVKDSLKAAVQISERYQVIDKFNRMYYVDLYGNETSDYSFSWMSVDDILYRITPGSRILPKEKGVRDASCWIEFNDPCYEEQEAIRKGRKERWLEFMIDTVYTYGLDEIWYANRYSVEAFEYYKIEVYHIPKRYKSTTLVSNKQTFFFSGDYERLPSSWIIAKKKGKYGVFDIRNPKEPVLPFVYKSITGIINHRTMHLILEKKGLKCYYPLNSTPCYKVLEPFKYYFARFELPDGRKGWLDLNGKEYLD